MLLNIASVAPSFPLPMLKELARSTARVTVFSVARGCEVGSCRRYWLDRDDLWTEAWLTEDAPEATPGLHGEAVIAMKHGSAVLCAVVLTTMPRGMLQQAALGKSFTDAVRAVLEAKFGRPPERS